MTTVAKKATPAALAVLRQATALKPKRKKASDGLLPSAAHLKQSPNSDHSINASDSTDTSPWFWWMNQPKIINQVKAAIAAVPVKKAYPVEDTSKCCKHCPSKK